MEYISINEKFNAKTGERWTEDMIKHFDDGIKAMSVSEEDKVKRFINYGDESTSPSPQEIFEIFAENEEIQIALKSEYKADIEYLVIPYECEYEGEIRPVKKIDTSIGIRQCPKLKTVIIPASITQIEVGAFLGDTELSKVFVPGMETGSTALGPIHAFTDCPNAEIICHSGSMIEAFAKDNGIKYRLDDARVDEEPTESSNNLITSGGVYKTFETLFSALEGVFGDTMNKINNLNYYGDISISPSDESLFENVYVNVARPGISLKTSIEEDEKNALIVIPYKRSDGEIVEGIGRGSDFSTPINIVKYLILPKNINTIGENAFRNFTGLHSMYIPIGVSTIGDNAFDNSPIDIIYYEGTEEDWGKIDIGDGNDSLSSAFIYYSKPLGTIMLGG